jgi:membrane protein DedA with SNARE-associated domain/rhodanese-related sulfurtransferase
MHRMPDVTSLMQEFGLALVVANVLVARLGVPIPAMPALVGAGALAAGGAFGLDEVMIWTLAAALAGEAAWYAAGRRYGDRAMRFLCKASLSPDSCVRQTESRFDRWGAWCLVLGKFVPGLATIGPPLAGASGIGWSRFLFLNGLGSLLWIAPSIALGMVFHEQVGELLAALDQLGFAATILLALLLALYVCYRWLERRRFMRMLRADRIAVAELRRLLDSREGAIVVDVRSPLARSADPRSIPGARLIDASGIDEHMHQLPQERDIVFYCSCPNDISAAVVAKKLLVRGYRKVRPLAGGLDAWVAAGYRTVSLVPETRLQSGA